MKVTAQCIRNMGLDMIMARFNGDKFAVLFPDIAAEESAIRAVEGFMKEIQQHAEDCYADESG